MINVFCFAGDQNSPIRDHFQTFSNILFQLFFKECTCCYIDDYGEAEKMRFKIPED